MLAQALRSLRKKPLPFTQRLDFDLESRPRSIAIKTAPA
jgi:hypothetical protein